MKKSAGQIIGIIIMVMGILTFVSTFAIAFLSFGTGDIINKMRLIPILAFVGIVLAAVGGVILGISGARQLMGEKGSNENDIISQIENLAKKNENLNNGKTEEEKMVNCPYCGSKNSSKDSRCKYCNGNLK